jgi:hypothetical protein
MSAAYHLPSKAARNERRKLTATFINGLAIAAGVLGVLRPIFDAAAYTGLTSIVISSAFAFATHMVARQWLRSLED